MDYRGDLMGDIRKYFRESKVFRGTQEELVLYELGIVKGSFS